MFDDLTVAPADPILGLTRRFEADSSLEKFDLGIGIYADDSGNAPVLDSVKRAEFWLAETQKTKKYLSSLGNSLYNDCTRKLIFGEDADLLERSRVIQAPGGTGAIRLAAEVLNKIRPGGRVFIPSPTWPNHSPILAGTAHEVCTYPYYDVARGTLRFDEMISTLSGLGPHDVVLLHGCCHNPSGADPNPEQWSAIGDTLAATGSLPFIDLAYLGFAQGMEEDAFGVRLLAMRVPELLIASSYSKNFALYRERVGALTVVAKTGVKADRAVGHLQLAARTLYSMPPDHGAAIVARILSDDGLRREWREEVKSMRDRINVVRAALTAGLAHHGVDRFAHVAGQFGMFAMLGLPPAAVEDLRSNHHVYVTDSGRANVAGLTSRSVDRVAASIAAVCKEHLK